MTFTYRDSRFRPYFTDKLKGKHSQTGMTNITERQKQKQKHPDTEDRANIKKIKEINMRHRHTHAR